VEFRVLGPLEVRADGREVSVGGPRQRVVLAALLLRDGERVRTEDLIGALWADPPATARRQVHNAVSQLRRALAVHGGGELLAGEPDGYRIRAGADRLDLRRFELLVADGKRLAATGDTAGAARRLRAAVRLWRGRLLEGVRGDVFARSAERLEQVRLSALEHCFEYELVNGAGDDLVAELSELVEQHPLRERLAAALMHALYRAGRQADALAAYHATAAGLAAELGVDPGPELRERYESILRQAPALEPGTVLAPVTRPAQLPAAVAHFAGRDDQLRRLDTRLEPDQAVVITALNGTAGVGKTTLAVHWAHRVAGRFPDGQLYVDLRGFDPSGSVMPPSEAIRGFLEALDVSADRIPVTLDAQGALYRSLLAGRRMLVLIDNARDADHVRPLMPGAPGCLVLVTSRDRLAGLVASHAARPVTLDLMTDGEARQLLTDRLGAGRAAAEASAVDEIVARCCGLPLALSIAAARAESHPDLPLAALAAELRDSQDRLDALTAGDAVSDVRAVFSWSYDTLRPLAAELFRLLGVHPGPDIGRHAIAALMTSSPRETQAALGELVRAHLLTEHVPGRFRFHDLLRVYADEQARAAGDNRVLLRMLDYYLHSASHAVAAIRANKATFDLPEPQEPSSPAAFADVGEATRWWQAEVEVLAASVDSAAEAGFDRHAWQLAWCVADMLERQGRSDRHRALQRVALAAATRTGDRKGQALVHRAVGRSYARTGHYEEALTAMRRALALVRAEGDRLDEANMLLVLGGVEVLQGRYEDGIRTSEQAGEIYRTFGHLARLATVGNNIGWARAMLGDYDAALAHCLTALDLSRGAAAREIEADVSDSLGFVHHGLNRYAEAVQWYERAIAIQEEIDASLDAAITRDRLGDTFNAMGDRGAADRTWRRAYEVLRAVRHPSAEEVWAKLARQAR
jgi:DNA-binding SARP family transcriptional activator/tetratricopeptide (TPR) repeat protein